MVSSQYPLTYPLTTISHIKARGRAGSLIYCCKVPVAEGEVDGNAQDEDEMGPAPVSVHQPVVVTKIFGLNIKKHCHFTSLMLFVDTDPDLHRSKLILIGWTHIRIRILNALRIWFQKDKNDPEK